MLAWDNTEVQGPALCILEIARYIVAMIALYAMLNCGSPVQKSNVILSHISIALLPSKRRVTKLPLRAGLICTS